MNLSREARLFCGVMLLTVPTIMYGGATLLGILTRGGAGVGSGLALDETQWALFRAGEVRLGVDTQLGQGSRLPELLPPLVLGQGALAEGRLAVQPRGS